jgi:hypothetical protein
MAQVQLRNRNCSDSRIDLIDVWDISFETLIPLQGCGTASCLELEVVWRARKQEGCRGEVYDWLL